MVPPWFAGEARGGGRRSRVLWLRVREKEKSRSREGEMAQVGGRVKGGGRRVFRLITKIPLPFVLFFYFKPINNKHR